MRIVQVPLLKIYMNGRIVCLEFEQSFHPNLLPGQFMSVRGSGDILPVPLFRGGVKGKEFTGVCTIPDSWHPGDLFTIRYPQGKGFSVPVSARRLLIVSGTSNPLRLLPVAGNVMADGGEAALFMYTIPNQIPPEIELLNRDELVEACRWADCIVGDTSIENLPIWKSLIAGGDRFDPKRHIQVLVDTPLVCNGSADCGVCAVKTTHGWKQACTDGPVFELSELEV